MKKYRSNWSLERQAAGFRLRFNGESYSYPASRFSDNLAKAEAAALRKAADLLTGTAPKNKKKTQSRERELLTTEQVTQLLDLAELTHGPNNRALWYMSSKYGHRLISLLKLTDANIRPGVLELEVKDPSGVRRHRHPIPQEDELLLRSLGPGRLFKAPDGAPWPIQETLRGSGRSQQAENCYKDLAQACGFTGYGQTGTMALKDYAITAMAAGKDPWPKALTAYECSLFTGHKGIERIIDRYRRKDLGAAAALLASTDSSDTQVPD